MTNSDPAAVVQRARDWLLFPTRSDAVQLVRNLLALVEDGPHRTTSGKKKKKPLSAKSLQLEIRQRCDRIAEERDALRMLIGVAQDICGGAADAVTALETAVDVLSEYL